MFTYELSVRNFSDSLLHTQLPAMFWQSDSDYGMPILLSNGLFFHMRTCQKGETGMLTAKIAESTITLGAWCWLTTPEAGPYSWVVTVGEDTYAAHHNGWHIPSDA